MWHSLNLDWISVPRTRDPVPLCGVWMAVSRCYSWPPLGPTRRLNYNLLLERVPDKKHSLLITFVSRNERIWSRSVTFVSVSAAEVFLRRCQVKLFTAEWKLSATVEETDERTCWFRNDVLVESFGCSFVGDCVKRRRSLRHLSLLVWMQLFVWLRCVQVFSNSRTLSWLSVVTAQVLGGLGGLVAAFHTDDVLVCSFKYHSSIHTTAWVINNRLFECFLLQL